MREKKNKKEPSETPRNQYDALQRILNLGPSRDDPNGSYTGKPENKYDVPVQDADDL